MVDFKKLAWRWGPALMIGVGLSMSAIGAGLLLVPTACHRSATNMIEIDRLAKYALGNRADCDPLARFATPIADDALYVVRSWAGYDMGGRSMLIRRDGSGALYNFLQVEPIATFTGSPDSFEKIAAQVAPLMAFSGTTADPDYPKDLLSLRLPLPMLFCEIYPSNYHSSRTLSLYDPRFGDGGAGKLDDAWIRHFDLDCDGPAGQSLNRRADIVDAEVLHIMRANGIDR